MAIGTAKTAAQRGEAVAAALRVEQSTGAALVVVAERWQGGFRQQRSSTRTIAGLGASWGRWAEQLEMQGHPARRVIRVPPFGWHKVLPSGRSTAKARALRLVAHRFPAFKVVSHDQAEAICIGLWGHSSPEVLALTPKRRQAARA